MDKSISNLDEFLLSIKEELALITMLCKMDDSIPIELRQLIGKTWPEIEFKIEESRQHITKIIVADLAAVGLTGDPLELKLTGFTFSLQSKNHRRVLRWANIILGSLSKVLPIVEPIIEYKEVLEEVSPLPFS